MKVLVITDVYGWAFWFAAMGMKKYSKHEVTAMAFHDTGQIRFGEFDCIFFMNQSCFTSLAPSGQSSARAHRNKCVGIRGGLPLMGCDQPIFGWKNACVMRETYDNLRSLYPNEKFYLCHNGVDTEIFKPVERIKERFEVGWAGNPNQSVKRCWMLDRLQFKVKRQQKWSYDYFHPDRSRQEMVDFYDSIDAYVCTSEREGMPQPILESAATKLPIVSTSCGGVPEFLDPAWLVPISPDQEAIRQINEKLQLLKDNSDLRLEVGVRNLREINEKWTWAHKVKEYEAMWES